MSRKQIMEIVVKNWDVTWDEWVSAGWWVHDSPRYGTLLGLWTRQTIDRDHIIDRGWLD